MSSVLTVRVTDEMKYQMDSLAGVTGRTRSWIAAEAIKQYLETESWQIGEIKKALVEADAGEFVSEEEMEQVFNKLAPENRGGSNAD